MYQNIAGLQLKNCMYSIYQAGRYDDLYCLNEKKTKEWNFTNQNTLFGDPLKTQIVVCQVWKNDSWDVGWDDCLRWKRKVRVWAQKQKKQTLYGMLSWAASQIFNHFALVSRNVFLQLDMPRPCFPGLKENREFVLVT
jgi:hypothetical protein